MKKHFCAFLTILLSTITVFSQNIYESFDDYNVGDNIGEVSPNFIPWEFDPDVDTKVQDDVAFSGSNAIRIYREGDYATDLVFRLNDSSYVGVGIYEFKTKMLVESGRVGYLRLDKDASFQYIPHFILNCQGGDCNFETDAYGFSTGIGNKVSLSFPYEENEWFELEVTMYRGENSNTYSVKVDGACIGQFSIKPSWPSTDINSFNIYAVENADFYLDDVSFVKIEDEFVGGDYHFLNLNNRIYGEEGGNVTINGGVRFKLDLPFENVNDYSIELNVNGALSEHHFQPIKEGAHYDYFCIRPDYQFDSNALVSARMKTIDGEPVMMNNTKCETENYLQFFTVSKERKRQVLVEGVVNINKEFDIIVENDLSLLQESFPNHVSAISVHRSQAELLLNDFDYFDKSGISGNLGWGVLSYDHGEKLFASNIYSEVLRIINQPAKLSLRNKATMIDDILDVEVLLEAFEDIPTGYDVAVIVTEDNVVGEGSEYDALNIFGGGNDAGYSHCDLEDAPFTIPASDMVYNRLPRRVEVLAIDNPINSGDTPIYSFQLEIPISSIDNYKIISVVRNEEGLVENSNTSTLQEALDTDFSTSVEDVPGAKEDFVVRYINNNEIEINYSNSESYEITVSSTDGKILTKYSNQERPKSNIDISTYPTGAYVVTIRSQEMVSSKMVVKY